jgi:hypothetical protein
VAGVVVAGEASPKPKEETPKAGSKVGQWLDSLELLKYEQLLLDNGYDDIEFLNGLLDEQELRDIGISDEEHIHSIMKNVEELPKLICDIQKNYLFTNNNNIISNSELDKSEVLLVENWLDCLHLGIYRDTFTRHLYTDMERIKKIWEIELTAVLDILKSGHRRRILASVNSPQRGGAGTGANLVEDISHLVSM